ncbi:MAG: preprotein translocase subunit SecY [Thermoprotei archaeon]|nr:MAG: preprotein translocase subunit SecY [Thermoprotei archaeon]
MASKFLEALEPVLRVLPEVSRPRRPVSFREKLFWTGLVLTLYMVMGQIPLYPLTVREGVYEPLFLLRLIFASRRGTLLELGIGPIVTAGLIFQLLVGSKIITVDFRDPRDRALYTGAQKFFAIVFTAVEALAYILGGAYGELPLWANILIFVQLMAAGVIIILLDELVQKGWGFGSGVSLFIAAGVAQQIFWLSLSPFIMEDNLPLGALLAFFAALQNAIVTGDTSALMAAFSRRGLPDMTGFLTMIAVFLIIAYLEGIRVDVPVVHVRYGGIRGTLPFKLLYVSNVPVILAGALLANLHLFSRIAWMRLGEDSWWLRYIAVYEIRERNLELVGGLLYYLTSPRSLAEAISDPVRSAIYVALFTLICTFFAKAWVETSGMDPRTQAQQLVDAGLQVPGFRRSPKIIAIILERYIPSFTLLSGIIVGLIAAVADMLGALGSGMGILLLIDIMMQYKAIMDRERIMERYPGIARLLGMGRA